MIILMLYLKKNKQN